MISEIYEPKHSRMDQVKFDSNSQKLVGPRKDYESSPKFAFHYKHIQLTSIHREIIGKPMAFWWFQGE